MKIIEGSGLVPVIYTAHHASHDFGEFSDRVALNEEQRIRFSDYGTSETVPMNGLFTIIAERSRALGDINWDPDNPGRFQDRDYWQPIDNKIWIPGQELTEAEKEYCHKNYYQPFHNAIVEKLRSRNEPTFVVSWDNTAHYIIGPDDAGETSIMKPFIISNRGKRESPLARDDEMTSCDPRLIEILVPNFKKELELTGLPNEVHLNLVYIGGNICRTYSSLRNKQALLDLGIKSSVQSLQLEYDTLITHDQVTLESKNDKIIALKSAFSKAIETSLQEYLSY